MQGTTSSQNNSKSSDDRAFQPEQPRRGPQVGTSRLGQDDAKRRLVRPKSPNTAASTSNAGSTHDNESYNASRTSTPTVTQQSPHPSSPTVQESDTHTSAVMQAGLGSSSGSVAGYSTSQALYRPHRIKIKEDVTKSTSFDRARDGDELYNLWVGPA